MTMMTISPSCDPIPVITPTKGKRVKARDELVWNVYVGHFNSGKIEVHNVFDHFLVWQDLRKAARKYKDSERPLFEEEVRKTMMYYYWSKCEWEVVIDHWPHSDRCHDMKVDVYDQLRLNWRIFCDYLWENRAVLRRREKVK